MLRRTVAGLTLGAAVAVGLTGCGSTTIKGTSAASAISRTLGQRYGVPPPEVSCPGQVPSHPGHHFGCVAVLLGQRLPVDAVVTGRSGQFRVRPALNVVSVTAAERTLEGDLSRRLHRPVTVTCPPSPALVVARRGTTMACRVTTGTRTLPLRVTFTGRAGGFTYALGAAAS